MTRPALSVAMTTYNGGAFLQEQLATIAAQTRPPDELVVADDASADGSVAIVERFAKNVDFPVRIIRAETNRGVLANVEIAITACVSDVIALADQDDRWYPEKLDVLERALGDDRENMLAFTDADLIDESGASLHRSLWESVAFDRAARTVVGGRDALQRLLVAHYVTGATVSFRAELRDLALPLPVLPGLAATEGRPLQIHDGWLAIVAASVGRVVPVAARTIGYRIHPGQHTGVPADTAQTAVAPRWQRFDPEAPASIGSVLLECLRARGADARHVARVERILANVAFRSSLPRSPLTRAPRVAREFLAGGYGRARQGLLRAAKDVVRPGRAP